MKNLMQHGRAVLLSLVVGFMLLVAACTKPLDPCAATNCQNGGVCDNGSCICPSGYEGAECATEMWARFVGDYRTVGSNILDSLRYDATDKRRLVGIGFNLEVRSTTELTILPNSIVKSGSAVFNPVTQEMLFKYYTITTPGEQAYRYYKVK